MKQKHKGSLKRRDRERERVSLLCVGAHLRTFQLKGLFLYRLREGLATGDELLFCQGILLGGGGKRATLDNHTHEIPLLSTVDN